MTPHEIPEDFRFTAATRASIAEDYPQLDIDKTEQAFIEWGTNAVETNKRHPRYGKPLECKNWQMKAKNVIRIQVVNKWTTIAIAKPGQEVDTRWQEVLKFASDVGYPHPRTKIDSVEGYRTKIKNWLACDRRVVNFELKVMK